MSNLLEGNVSIVRYNGICLLKGFTDNDWITLSKLARKHFKIKTKRKRIVKKYVKRLVIEAMRKYTKGILNANP
jgi:hypothetical protein